ncbi:NUDIX domain-containing protein [Phenylobacterium sp.]|uniref:NUDIX domain-containing protein n=1 Tax=Phenylobacterium sp. TaxID=1871053 RepID=UPI0025F1C489|nr:NUDIX domain-containing protein [Phenylobacterium sp.]MBX3484042.1 NUDIX domain-containing protein [Phenylobacterium sp.]MCW5761530.1 NUDIX domain-containing protein [Phenylobacterium sp.]
MARPQFGDPPAGYEPADRPAAFCVIERDGLIALVEVAWEGRGLLLHLPGGGLDEGETEAQAAVRECGEEAGLSVRLDAAPFVHADHYFLHHDRVIRNTRGVFFAGRVAAEDAALKTEDDHRLVWMEPGQAVVELERESHAWAVAAWLRLRARA